MAVTIRRSNIRDIERLEQLYQEYMRIDGSRREALRSAMEEEGSLMRVAEAEGRIVGLTHQVFYMDPLHAGECSSLLFLYVAEAFRRRGVAGLLVKAALRDAEERGIIEVHVSTRADNDIAIKLYKGLGFEYAGPLFEHDPHEARAKRYLAAGTLTKQGESKPTHVHSPRCGRLTLPGRTYDRRYQ